MCLLPSRLLTHFSCSLSPCLFTIPKLIQSFHRISSTHLFLYFSTLCHTLSLLRSPVDLDALKTLTFGAAFGQCWDSSKGHSQRITFRQLRILIDRLVFKHTLELSSFRTHNTHSRMTTDVSIFPRQLSSSTVIYTFFLEHPRGVDGGWRRV